MKKRLHSLILTFALVLGLVACAKAPTWQEQYDLGVRYLSEGNYQEAIIAFTAAIEIDPKQADAYLGLFDAYVAVSDYEGAQATIVSGRKVCGDNVAFDAALRRLTEIQEDKDSKKLTKALRSGVLTFDDIPEIFFTPFDQLGEFVGLEPGKTLIANVRGLEYDVDVQEVGYFYELSGVVSGSIAGAHATAPLGSSEVIDFWVDNSHTDSVSESYYKLGLKPPAFATPVGWKDICIGDSMKDVLTKLGLDPELSKYSVIDINLSKDTNAASAGVDTEAWTFIGDTPIVSIYVSFSEATDFHNITFEFADGGSLYRVIYSNPQLW